MWYNMELIKGLIKLLEEYLSDFGFNKSQINHILNYYSIFKSNKYTIYNIIKSNNEWFISHEFTKKEIIKMVNIVPSIYTLSSNKIQANYNYFISFGYTEEQTHKIFSRTPQVIGFSIENIKEKINYLFQLGYSKEQIIKLTFVLPSIFCYSIENIESKINNYNRLGISNKDLIKMSLISPSIYSVSEDNVNTKINDLLNLGLTYEEVIKMVISFPPILGLSIETIKEKVDFYRESNILNIVINNPKYLMQSVNLSYARYMFYLVEKKDIITHSTYKRLFVGDKQFSKQFNISKEELLQRYNYEESRSKSC